MLLACFSPLCKQTASSSSSSSSSSPLTMLVASGAAGGGCSPMQRSKVQVLCLLSNLKNWATSPCCALVVLTFQTVVVLKKNNNYRKKKPMLDSGVFWMFRKTTQSIDVDLKLHLSSLVLHDFEWLLHSTISPQSQSHIFWR